MICPACQRELVHLDAGNGVTLDACDGGCGGVWFDNFELQKFDEAHEAQGSAVFDVKPMNGAAPAPAAPAPEESGAVRPLNRPAPSTPTDKRVCPRCACMKMRRFFYNAAKTVEVDQCANCGGHWLDFGELEKIRQASATKVETDFDRAKAEDKLLHAIRFHHGRGHR